MSGYKKYDESSKKSLVNLHQVGETQTSLCQEYGISFTALSHWVKQRMTASLVTETIELASQNHTHDEPVIFHSNQESQYTSQAVRQALDKHRLVASFSKKAYLRIMLSMKPFLNT
ncbi:transposase [Listeria booriae]|uniref:Transposase n=1 Tax=Listeria booriae TaxID=1552123 RepID=A0A842AHW4_9LIST|nr:transposase [Listeria booriae]MBC1400479.1 transposase [Listeria booriae]MBC1615795.1 transposase [Listeria booriae]MBC2319301.1 transposase [Listeria booriae]